MAYRLKLKSIEPVTHDTFHLTFDKPDNLDYAPGQAVDMTLCKEGLKDEERPFTFAGIPEAGEVEFVIKTYPEHEGVTKEIAKLKAGDEVEISEPWGAFHDAGAGTFIAGGAGITPFIAILRKRLEDLGTLEGCKLIFSNAREKDIILREEFEAMKGLKTIFTVTEETPDSDEVKQKMIDEGFLAEHVNASADAPFYICGPDKMVEDVKADLIALGAQEDDILTEEFID